ncbi:MAG: MarR family winged helix-turn-helix transcriptional regulator [Rhodothermaceae bacterium]
MNDDIFFILHNISKKMRKIADNELAVFGLTNTEMRILNMIYFFDADGCTQDEFLSQMEIDRSNVGRALKKLEKLEYIKREKDKNDQRAFKVFLTKKGWSIKDDLLAIRENMKKTISLNYSEKEFERLVKLLKKADTNLTEENYKEIKNK